MQYLISVIDDKITPGPPGDMPAIGVFNDRLRAEGHWVYANGLSDPSAATVVDGRGEEPLFTDGPFLESREYLAGFWVIEAPDLDVALRICYRDAGKGRPAEFTNQGQWMLVLTRKKP